MIVKRKFIKILILMCVLLPVISSGCSKDEKASSSSNTQNTLNMYVNYYDKRTLAAIKEFNSTNVVQIHPSIVNNDQIKDDEYLKKLTTSILAGEGPDILLDSPYGFPSLNKIVQNKVFCDLTPYISDDKEFDISNFYTKVLDCGVIDEERYYIPLNFQVPCIWSTTNLLEKNNIMIDGGKWTLNDLKEINTKYIKKQNTKKYLTTADFQYIMASCWNDYINTSQKQAKFDSEAFIRLLDAYKSIYPSILDRSKLKEPESYFEYMKSDSLLFADIDLSSLNVWMINTAANKILNSQIELFLYPGISGENHPSAFVYEFVAINNSCSNKKGAFEFLKLLLSEKYQNFDSYATCMPVNKKAYKSFALKYCGDSGNNKPIYNYLPLNSTPYTSISLSNSLIKQIDAYFEDIDSCYYIDGNILEMISEEVDLFIQEKQTSSQTAKSINNRVNLYLNE